MTEIQNVVVEARKSVGYVVLGKYNSLSTCGITVGIMKGKHRMQINCLGYDEYQGNAVAYKEVK